MKLVDKRIEKAARDAARGAGLEVQHIEHFLRTGEETWEGSGSGRFTLAELKLDGAYREATSTALRTLFESLAALLPPEAQNQPPIPRETIVRRIEPMVIGLLPRVWCEVAIREITARLFILNFPGTRAALNAELTTCDMSGAWRVVWSLYEDYGLKPEAIKVGCEGMASDYAHVRWSAFESEDPYSDVVVHEAAHMLHYLKPEYFGFTVRRGQERFLDVEFRCRELFAYACEAYSRVIARGDRKSRMAFAEAMNENAFSFPTAELEVVVPLVVRATQSRNGWGVIREAVLERRTRRTKHGVRPSA